MNNITDQTVFKITAEGDKELQWRTHGVPKDIRFLLMLINGSRDVRTLRLVSESARESNAVFEFLLIEGLIADRDADLQANQTANTADPPYYDMAANQAASDEMPVAVPTQSNLMYQQQVPVNMQVDPARILINPMIDEEDMTPLPIQENQQQSNDPAFAFGQAFGQGNQASIQNQNSNAEIRMANDKVSSQQLAQAIAIVRQGLGRDADAMIEKLVACENAQSFREAVLKVEQVFREHISAGLANDLHRIAGKI
jgi:hypothetical protein